MNMDEEKWLLLMALAATMILAVSGWMCRNFITLF